MEIENNHNVYILGAGFSREANLPLIRDFLEHMRDSHQWLFEAERKREAEAVEAVLDFRLKASSAAYWSKLDLENIEELFSLASATDGSLAEKIQIAIGATLDHARSVLSNLSGRIDIGNAQWKSIPQWIVKEGALQANSPGFEAYKMNKYKHYVAKLLGRLMNDMTEIQTGRNSFITFNYDTLLEDALYDMDVPFKYCLGKGGSNFDESMKASKIDDGIPILKLHGSVNWAKKDEGKGRQFTVFGSYSDIQSRGLVPELLPPTWKKDFNNQLLNVWEEAVRVLRTATRVVVIGFSMPPADMHFKYLLAAGLQNNISLRNIYFIDPNPDSLRERAFSMLRNEYIDSEKIKFVPYYMKTALQDSNTMIPIGRAFGGISCE